MNTESLGPPNSEDLWRAWKGGVNRERLDSPGNPSQVRAVRRLGWASRLDLKRPEKKKKGWTDSGWWASIAFVWGC